ncbi:hypothetical protein Pelo_9715 [Pelomyxa schiedti]|nr:hypothetical protein Pelo_9715 [Pelomyxa schiedti]
MEYFPTAGVAGCADPTNTWPRSALLRYKHRFGDLWSNSLPLHKQTLALSQPMMMDWFLLKSLEPLLLHHWVIHNSPLREEG